MRNRYDKKASHFKKLGPAMKIWCICTVALLLIVPAAHARNLEFNTKAKNLHVKCTIDRNPPIIGDNHLEIEITDGATGGKVTDAKVLVNYYMPPMPRMAPMNYKTNAEPKGDHYEVTMHIIMAGPWFLRVVISHAGKRTGAKFSFDAQ